MKEAGPECFVSPWGEADESVLEALNRGRAAAGLAPRSKELWRWRQESPGGACLGLWRADGAVRAAVVGVRHRVLLEGEPVTWLEVVDLYNDFDAGRGLRRADRYLATCRDFAREYGGRVPDGIPIFHGTPNRRAHRIGLARLGHEILRSENVLVAPLDTHAPEPAAGVDVEEIAPGAKLPDVEPAFLRFRESRAAIGVRDTAWLEWRYRRHPERRYRIAVARRGGELHGYAVLRRGGFAGHAGGLLVDWIAPPGDRGVGWELLAWAAAATREDGGEVLACNVPDKAPEWHGFQALGFRVFGTDEYLVMRSFQKPYVMSWLFTHWYYTLGDSERG